MSSVFMESLAGIDEVGRGSLAGPVFLGMVILPDTFPLYTASYNAASWSDEYISLHEVRDSKKLSIQGRENFFKLVIAMQLPYYLLSASASLIDEYGIGVCLSHMVLLHINIANESRIIIDGKIKILKEYNEDLLYKLKQENNYTQHLKYKPSLEIKSEKNILVERENKADDKYLSIALASIMAKVTRDQLMEQYHQKYPEYNWSQNKGYGTLHHRNAIIKNPNNTYLRKTFLSKIIPQN